jgi:hypothetical protein
MRSKRGIIGSFVSMFFATIVIVVILGIFIIASGFVKEAVRTSDSFGVQNETDVGVGDVFDYIDENFSELVELRISVSEGGFLNSDLSGGGG